MAKISTTKKYRKSWCALAQAIIDSGIKENDKAFLESEWCKTLQDLVACEDDSYVGTKLWLDPTTYKE